MDEDGEPIGRGQLDRRAPEAQALQGAVFAVAVSTGVVLVNGILAILLIELVQVIGWWEASTSESASEAASEGSRRFRVGVAFAD